MDVLDALMVKGYLYTVCVYTCRCPYYDALMVKGYLFTIVFSVQVELIAAAVERSASL